CIRVGEWVSGRVRVWLLVHPRTPYDRGVIVGFRFFCSWVRLLGREGWRSWVGPAVAVAVISPWSFRPSGLAGDHQVHRLVTEEWVVAWHQGVWWPVYLDDVNAGLGSP